MQDLLRQILVGLLFASSVAAFALSPLVYAAPLVPCGVDPTTLPAGGDTTAAHPCGFNDFVTLVQNIVNFLIMIGAGVATIAFAYAGYLMITAGGESAKLNQAKSIFVKVVIGIVLMLAAWLIVHTIQCALVSQGGITSFLGSCGT